MREHDLKRCQLLTYPIPSLFHNLPPAFVPECRADAVLVIDAQEQTLVGKFLNTNTQVTI